jgi:SAM-dependent methyltransferase
LEPALRAALYGPLDPDVAAELLVKEEAQLATRPWCRLLLTRMGPQAQREREIAANLPSLSASGDTVSGAVQAQYEESPYPRWRELRSGGEVALPALLKRLFPGMTPPFPAEKPAVLVAGCGTGRHALRTAKRIIGAEVTAIDLSRRSLAYGARQSEEHDISNVTFAQADIVDLPDSLGQFDLIEACGVLHHMADPEGAWRGLTRFLAPHGVMKVALYSEQARQDVIAVREMVGDRIDSLTLDDIRRLRKELLALPEDHPAASVTQELDFYSLSGCRDFLFHRHEQRFDIPRIKAAIDDLGLEFLGFEFTDPQVMTAYRARHPDDPSGRSLANWQAIETENPMLFRGMYQFWCRMK